MSLEAVLAAIEAESEHYIHQLKADSEKRIQIILQNHKEQAEKRSHEIFISREKEAYEQSARLLRHAQHEADMIKYRGQNELIETALRALREKLSTFRAQPEYTNVLQQLIIESFSVLSPSLKDGETPCLEADPRDEKILISLLKSPGLLQQVGPLNTCYPLTCAGGINLTSEDKKIVVQNTLESRFTAALPELRHYLASRIK